MPHAGKNEVEACSLMSKKQPARDHSGARRGQRSKRGLKAELQDGKVEGAGKGEGAPRGAKITSFV